MPEKDIAADPADAPPGFTLEAEASRQDEAAAEGITVRDADPYLDDDHDDDGRPADEHGRADDDDAEDEPDDDGELEDL